MSARMDAAVTVDAQNAPTATWKTAQNAVYHSAHTHHRLIHEIPDTPSIRFNPTALRAVQAVSIDAIVGSVQRDSLRASPTIFSSVPPR